MAWFRESWFDLVQSLALLLTLIFTGMAVRQNSRALHATNIVAMTDLRRETWQLFMDRPELHRILADRPNPPEPSRIDHRFIVSVLDLVHATLELDRVGRKGTFARNLDRDVAELLHKPIPEAIWTRIREFYPEEFERFIAQALANYPP